MAEATPKKPEYKLLGHNYELPDLVAKVTGRAKYAEDFRAEGMLFARLLLSPLPHARLKRIDTSAALAMPGVVAVLTGEDVPKPQQPMQQGEAPAQRANTAANRFHYNKPPTILDIPLHEMAWGAVEIPDPQTPIGAKGTGEPAIAAG
ncbi:MAG: xanthine dehydrogenase family protein, partial [Vicinamibacterales bacterium]|nr:xanthine dehydrogenase family protein [Vicinamibacterales bacterium]